MKVHYDAWPSILFFSYCNNYQCHSLFMSLATPILFFDLTRSQCYPPFMRTIRKVFDFCASHTLARPEWSREKNFEVFGKCSNPNGHGHNYRLEVIIAGEVDSLTGMIMDASKIAEVVNAKVIEDVDHRDLNRDVPWLEGRIPSAENFVDAIWDRIEPEIKSISPTSFLLKLKLWETRTICATRDAH